MVRKTDIKKAGSASFDSDPAGTLISELNQILGVLVFWCFRGAPVWYNQYSSKAPLKP